MPKTIKVGVVTQEQGAHLPDYFAALAPIEEAEAVTLSDPSGKSVDAARKALGAELKEVYKDPAELRRFLSARGEWAYDASRPDPSEISCGVLKSLQTLRGSIIVD